MNGRSDNKSSRRHAIEAKGWLRERLSQFRPEGRLPKERRTFMQKVSRLRLLRRKAHLCHEKELPTTMRRYAMECAARMARTKRPTD